MTTAKEVIEIALNEVGYLEKASNKNLDDKTANAGKNNYTKYARDLDNIAGFYNGKKQGFAWCDVFVDWCFFKAFGVDNAKRLLCQPNKSLGAGCKYSRNYYKNNGQLYTSPQVGDQIFFYNSNKSGIAHTGMVYKVDKTYVYTVEGNTSSASGVVANGGAVAKKKYNRSYSRIAGYGRPKYDVDIIESGVKSVTVNLTQIKKGDSGEEVKTTQRLLNALGFDCGKYGDDGDFGDDTEKAVKAFQKAKGETADGIVGAKTWNRLLKG